MNFKHYLITLFTFLLFGLSLEVSAQTIKRGPYLQLSTSSSITIRWRTDVSTSTKVWYGTDASNLNLTATESGTTKEHDIKISGLSSATKYYYRIGNNSGQYAELNGTTQYFKTHPGENSNDGVIRAWMLGNAGTGDPEQEEVRDAYYSVVGDEHVDMILFTGDNAYEDGKDSEYQELIFDMYESRLANTTSWSCFGNHDAGDAESSDESGTYYDIFNFPRNAEAGGLPTGTEAYFSFDYGNMHVISLNTVDVDREPDGEMLQWLEADLAATERKWKVVLLHHRPYTGSNDNDSDDDPKPTDVRENFLPIMEAGGVDLVLSSHSHSYQRSFLINGHYGTSNTFSASTHGVDMGDGQVDGDGAYSKIDSDIGTVYVVAGTAGQEDNDADELNHPVMHYNSGSPGSVQLLVSDSELLFQFINNSEEVEDHFTIQKEGSNVDGGFVISNPLNGSSFPPQQNITITTELSEDNRPLVQEVDFYVNNNYVGTDNTFPYYQSWTVPAVGAYLIKAKALDATGEVLFESKVEITAGAQEFCTAVSTGTDDAEQYASGFMKLGSGDLELVQDADIQQVGLRFTGVGIAPETMISEAYIQFTTDETKNANPSQMQIFGEKNPNPSTFAQTTNNISNRNKTNTSANWSPPNWESIGQSGTAQRSPNVAGIIQEIINQPGYTSNSALAFIITGTGKRVAEAYEGDSNKAAKLCISYMPSPCADADNDGICDDNDPCPTGPEFGLPCNDNNPATFNDLVDENCNCIGTPGFCPNLQLAVGATCNDNNPTTYDDVVNPDCNCVGTPVDCPLLLAAIGDVCNDNNNATYNDVVTADCNCAGTPFDCPLFLADIGSPCNDGNPNTSNDILDANCNCIGSLFDCPIIERNFGDPCDDGNPQTINDVVTTDCNCAGTLLQEETVSISVNTGSDDAEQDEDGGMNLNSGDLELVDDGELQVVGVRFLETGIPAGASITNAYIQFTVDETKNINPCNITITGQNSNNATTFAYSNQNISSRPRTTAAVSWQPNPWTSTGLEGVAQRTADLSNIVQEMVNKSGYTDASPMAFIFEGQGKRVAESYDGEPQKAPRLVVSYVFFCEDDDGDGICNPQDLCNGAEPGTPCEDNNAATFNDVIDANCNCVGTPYDCAILLGNVGDACNDGDPQTLNDAIDANCDCTGLPPGSSQTICTRVATSDDDAEEEQDGNVNTGSSDLELIVDDVDQVVGIRFANLGLPQGAVIEEATIQFQADETNNINPCQLTISAEAVDNAAIFSEDDFNISNRPRTNATVTWSPATWTAKGEVSPAQKTINLASILQEVVSRPGFSENSSVAFIIEGYGKRVAEAYDGEVDGAAELCVTYSMSAPTLGMTAPPSGNEITKSARSSEEGFEKEAVTESSSSAKESLKVYPNPTQGSINLAFFTDNSGEAQVQIQDVNGQLMLAESYGVVAGKNVIRLLDLNLANGVYVVRIWNGVEWESGKFVVLK